MVVKIILINLLATFSISNFCFAQDSSSYYQQYIDREKKYVVSLLNAKTEKDFYIILSGCKPNSLIWSYLPFFYPLDKNSIVVSSGFGYRVHPITGKRSFHKGIDIPISCGTKVIASGNGCILDTGYDPYLGNFIKIVHGFKWISIYGHLSQIDVFKNQKVSYGQVIGLSGTTGRSTGCHLHYGIYYNKVPVSSLKYIKLLIHSLQHGF
ncbi:MAG TPA: M23 family metallopeptidase [Chitinophagaceae bacterium]|nr:M23 family metallopeptidase [Chitinophagaceae bacterium]